MDPDDRQGLIARSAVQQKKWVVGEVSIAFHWPDGFHDFSQFFVAWEWEASEGGGTPMICHRRASSFLFREVREQFLGLQSVAQVSLHPQSLVSTHFHLEPWERWLGFCE